jgi:TfoX/Sxy family transcriptional regulator of competence genes
MAFDEDLADSVPKHLNRQAGLTEKKMFGGLEFLITGNMGVGVHRNQLIVRIDPATTDDALRQ